MPVPIQKAQVFGGADFSLRGFVLGRPKPRRLKPALPMLNYFSNGLAFAVGGCGRDCKNA